MSIFTKGKGNRMKVLGIDPGIATTGFGVCRFEGGKFSYVNCGVIETAKGQNVEARIEHVYQSVLKLIDAYEPEAMAIEELFYHNNQKTFINVAQARGVVLLAARQKNLPVFEYTPLQVKVSVTGYGRAEKYQVQEMMKVIFRLPGVPKPDDAADALAIAVCHCYRAKSKFASIHTLDIAKTTGGN